MSVQVRASLRLGTRAFEFELASESAAIAIQGPSGIGKSRFLRVVAGLESEAQGMLRFRGELWQDSREGVFVPAWRRQIGWVPQDALLFPHLCVRENLAFAGGGKQECQDMAASLGLSALLARKPRHLSGGERQRVALGRALLSRPRLLLLDEPFSALPEDVRDRLMKEVVAFCEERSVPLILVTHQRREAFQYCREVWEFGSDGNLTLRTS